MRMLDWAKNAVLRRKTVACIFLAILLFSLIPLLVISFYNRPYSDDYSYGNLTAHAWREKGSLLAVIVAALQTVKQYYYSWQGTFSAVFMFALQPGIYSEKLYYLSTLFLIGTLLASIFYFFHAVILHGLKADVWTWIIISSMASLLSVQFVHSPNDAFYWYNGGVFYTFFYSVLLILLGFLIKIIMANAVKGMPWRIAFTFLLSVAVGGGNYITALIGVLLLGLMVLICFILKRKTVGYVLLAFLVTAVALAISAIAPGNAVRAAALRAAGNHPLTFFQAVCSSFVKATDFIKYWTTYWMVSAQLLLVPLYVKLANSIRFQFRWPLAAMTLIFCLFSAQFSPPILMGVFGDGRHLNILYYSYVLSTMGILFYLVGWFVRAKQRQGKIQLLPHLGHARRYGKVLNSVIAVLLSVVTIYGFAARGGIFMASIYSLKNGEAAGFAATRDERLAQYLNPAIGEVYVKPLSARPAVFWLTDLWYKDWWVNQVVAAFYDKESVTLIE